MISLIGKSIKLHIASQLIKIWTKMSAIFSHEKGGTRRKYNAYLYTKIKFILKRK
jgi:hypothetical protein